MSDRPTDPGASASALWALKKDLDERHEANVTSNDKNARKLAEVSLKVDQVLNGFANGDPAGHRVYHEKLIRKEEERGKFYSELRTRLTEKGIWAVIVLVGAALWLYVQSRLKL